MTNITADERGVDFIEEEKEVSNGLTVATFRLADGATLQITVSIETASWIAQQLAHPHPLPFAHATTDGVRIISLANVSTFLFQGAGAAVDEIKTEVGTYCPLRQIEQKKR